jgi:hypothetical protein
MKRGLLVLALSLSLPVYSFAQRGGMGHGGNGGLGGNGQPVQIIEDLSTLSIFSETGESFYLVLNGVKQNLVPESKIRVEALPQYMTDLQIQFANSRMPPIRKRIVVSDPLDGKAVSLTLKISSGRGGYAKLEFHRMSGCDHNYRGPGDEYVMYYGKPQQVNTTTETTYTDPVTGDMVTQTTTTMTTKDNYTTGYTNPVPPAPMAMSQATFNDVRQSITGASFEDTKLSTAKTILKNNFVNTAQVIEICKLFSFENTKLTFAKYAYSRTVDPNNYYKVASVLDFDSNKKTLNNFISAHPR